MERTPGIYTGINTQTQRTGLPSQSHSIVFVTSDAAAPATPTPVYDTASADAISGADSNVGRMMAAALSISQGVRVEMVGKSEGGGAFNPIVCTPEHAEFIGDYYPNFSGIDTVHARYRINNGSWIDYVGDPQLSENTSDVISDFLTSIRDSSNTQLVATTPETPPTPFYCPGGSFGVYSGADPESPLVHYLQASLEAPLATKIDFVVTGDKPADLIATMFNGDVTIISCAIAKWQHAQ